MAVRAFLIGVAFLVACASMSGAFERPRCGQGVLLLRSVFDGQSDMLNGLVIYAFPGIQRLTVINASHLPSLAPSVLLPAEGYAVAVTEKRGNWFRIAYDNAGREGWVEGRRFWHYSSWQDFLAGRSATVLPGLRAELTIVREKPADAALSLGSVLPDQQFRIVETRDDWVRVSGRAGLAGWLRWQDGNGKLLIAVE